jgi:Holliday junction resolvase-like predicted endonuclease
LFYWHQEALNSNAEIDYLIQKQNEIIPIEVKSGTKGTMNSMFLFLKEKKAKYGCRLSLENFAEYENIKVVIPFPFDERVVFEKEDKKDLSFEVIRDGRIRHVQTNSYLLFPDP